MKKKILSILYTLFVTLLLTSTLEVNAEDSYRFEIDNQQITYVEGMEHRRVNGTMTFNGKVSSQYYNYLSLNNTANGYHLVSADGYVNNGYGMHSLATFIEKYEEENPHMEVLAGVNGSFYYINDTGQATTTHIRDYEVISPPLTNPSIALTTNSKGEHKFVDVVQEGNEVIIYNKYNEIKYRNQVSKLNQNPKSNDELTVLFDNYVGDVPKDLNPVYIEGFDIKPMTQRKETHANYYTYAKGKLVNSSEEVKVPLNHFVIFGEEFRNIIEEDDVVLFQAKLKDFEDVRSAVSTTKSRGPLVVNGVIDPILEMDQHPRTAIGIKENGDLFFIVVDGRDRLTPKHGVSLPEFAHLMYSYGAHEAFNFDGGGSSTLMLKNGINEGGVLDRFDVLNELADKRLRSLSNAFLVVKGEVLSKPVDIRKVGDRGTFDTPQNLYIDENFNLNFDPVIGAERYEIFINDIMIETSSTIVPLKKLSIGVNKIEVRVKGTTEYMTSYNSNTLNYKIHSTEVRSLLELLKNRK